MHISIPFPELGFISTKLLDSNGTFSLLILTAKISILIVHSLKEWSKKPNYFSSCFVIKTSNRKRVREKKTGKEKGKVSGI